MVILPIEKKLKKKLHKNIALAQDILVMETYDKFSNAVVHGGTAIWRCFGSNRFSEDVDFYLPRSLDKEKFEKFLEGLKNKGLTVQKFKFTENSIFSKISYLDASTSFEAVFKNVKNFITKKFELIDGNFILVNTLKPEEFIEEKVSAYLKRKKVRDLYDIFFLLDFAEEKEKVRKSLKKLLESFERPRDEKELKVLIISGSIPKVDEMLEVIKKWAK
ncbi:MAG: nucleotidyl transferase AbiEii/AbiGii toxin family protein [Thermoproteota archaeon]|jgi:predicted nucleotidyltransferase component of viral defense system